MTSCTCTGTPPWVQNTLSSLFTWVTSELKVMWTCCRFCEIVLNDLDYSALHHLSLLGCKSTLSLFFVDVWKFHRRLWTQVTLTKFTVHVYGSTWRSFFFSSYMYLQMIIYKKVLCWVSCLQYYSLDFPCGQSKHFLFVIYFFYCRINMLSLMEIVLYVIKEIKGS